MIPLIGPLNLLEGGPIPSRFREIWLCDFEFNSDGGERPRIRCMVAREFRSGREIRMWANQLSALRCAPFDVGPNALFVAYYTPAEMGCFLRLDWPLPQYSLDLYVEHRVETNGLLAPKRNRLSHALEHRHLSHINCADKDEMISLILSKEIFSPQERRAILDYCASDVYGMGALLPIMAPHIDWPRALFRGHYMKANACVVHYGIPIDTSVFDQLSRNWGWLRHGLIRSLPDDFDAYVEDSFNQARFLRWCDRHNVPWPRLASGAPNLRKKTLDDLKDIHPTLRQLHEVRSSLGAMRLADLAVGSDGHNRTMLSSFGSLTARNTPSSSESVFGPATWMRGLIKPPEGWAIAYLDFSSQEFAIAAALSGDEQMVDDYASGDPYLRFAVSNGLAPEGATRKTHDAIREVCKKCSLGVSYGMEANSMAVHAQVQPLVARIILQRHKERYPIFWRWVQGVKDRAQMDAVITTALGWKRHIKWMDEFKPRSVQNWPMQSTGAEIMRIVVTLAIDAGVQLCMPVHDGFLIVAPIGRIQDDVTKMRSIMDWAGKLLAGGMEIRVDCKVFSYPDRYMDKRGLRMWDHINGLLRQRRTAA